MSFLSDFDMYKEFIFINKLTLVVQGKRPTNKELLYSTSSGSYPVKLVSLLNPFQWIGLNEKSLAVRTRRCKMYNWLWPQKPTMQINKKISADDD